jgi:hypothetical protein
MPLLLVACNKERKDRAKVLKSRKISLAADLGGWGRITYEFDIAVES